jgi:hypothetical protein
MLGDWSARIVIGLLVVAPVTARAQAGTMVHTPGMQHDSPTSALPTRPGQDAYAAIAEVARLLDADPATDWSRVDLEKLRQHLVDMSEVTLRARVASTPVPGGIAMRVTGSGRTRQAIRTMVPTHAASLRQLDGLGADVTDVADGVLLTVRATTPGDARAVQRIRGLGFAGIMTLGDHHAAHHLALARGATAHAHDP